MTIQRGIFVHQTGIIANAGYAYKDACRLVPSGKWDKENRVWRYPCSPIVARQLVQAFENLPVPIAEAVKQLAEDAPPIQQSQGYKTREDLPEIPGSTVTSWMHQRQAYYFAEHLPGVMLHMDMGTGKSKVALDLTRNRGSKLTLILAPKQAVRVWPKQFRLHYPAPEVLPLDGQHSVARKAETLSAFLRTIGDRPAAVIVGHHAAWREELAAVILRTKWDTIIVDESHKAKQASGALGKFVGKLHKCARWRLCLSGTALPHSILDAFAQYRFLQPEIFGSSVTAFRKRFAVYGGYLGYEVVGYVNQEQFRSLWHSICYECGPEVLDLPPMHHVLHEVEIGAKAAGIYQQLETDLIALVKNGEVTAKNGLVKLLRLHEITSGYATVEPIALPDAEQLSRKYALEVDTAKREALEYLLEGIADKAVVFCLFRHDLEVVKEVTESLGKVYAELSGSTNQLTEDAEYPPWADVLAVQIASGGAGVDLTLANKVIYYSVGFNGGDYSQSVKRTHRPGQLRPVTYWHLVAKQTVDEDIYGTLAETRNQVQAITGGWDAEAENAAPLPNAVAEILNRMKSK